MKCVVAVAGLALSLTASIGASAEPALMLNEPRDVISAESSCHIAAMPTASGGIVDADTNAACKVSGPIAEVRAFHSKLLAQFASNPQCRIAIIRVTNDKSDAAVQNNHETLKRANWELNLGFRPGSMKQQWALWLYQSGMPTGTFLEGEGDPAQVARDVCTIVTQNGAKILN